MVQRELNFADLVTANLIATHHEGPLPLRQLWVPKGTMPNSAICTSACTSYNMVHPSLTESETFSKLIKKEKGRKRVKERGRRGVECTVSLN